MNKNLSYTRSKCYENSIQTISMEVASNQHKIPGNVNLVYIAVLSSHSVCNETSTLYKFSLLSVRFVVALLAIWPFSSLVINSSILITSTVEFGPIADLRFGIP